jgi:hypothetical protein
VDLGRVGTVEDQFMQRMGALPLMAQPGVIGDLGLGMPESRAGRRWALAIG